MDEELSEFFSNLQVIAKEYSDEQLNSLKLFLSLNFLTEDAGEGEKR